MDVFKLAVTEIQGETIPEGVEAVHTLLVHKVYNARCNEFLRTISKLTCMEKGKRIDSSVSLRDELKVCVLSNNSITDHS